MDLDLNKNLTLEINEIDNIITNVFRFGYTEQSQFETNILGSTDKVQYEDFMKKIVVYQICEIDPKKNIYLDEITEQDFIDNVVRATSFVDVRPS